MDYLSTAVGLLHLGAKLGLWLAAALYLARGIRAAVVAARLTTHGPTTAQAAVSVAWTVCGLALIYVYRGL